MNNMFDYIMSFCFKYSDPIFKLVYDKNMRNDLFLKIINSKPNELMAEDPSKYMEIKWINEDEINKLMINSEENSDLNGLDELTYFKQDLRVFKINLYFLLINSMTLFSMYLNSKQLKFNPTKRKIYAFMIGLMAFVETPYIVLSLQRPGAKDLEAKYKKELEKYKMFYKL
jgi:hypothetical protein